MTTWRCWTQILTCALRLGRFLVYESSFTDSQLALWSGSTDFHLFIYFCIKSILKHKSLDRNLWWHTYLLHAQQLMISVSRVAQIDWCFFVIGESGQARLCMLGGRGGFWESDAAVLFRLRLLSPSCRELGDSPDRLWMLIKFSGSMPALWSATLRVIFTDFFTDNYIWKRRLFFSGLISVQGDNVCDKKMQFPMMWCCRGLFFMRGNIFCMRTSPAVLKTLYYTFCL